MPRARHPVVIIGGGYSGAAVAWHLARMAGAPATIPIVEPRGELGRGLAYGTADPSHRINVPSIRMSLDPERGEHFEHWLRANDRPKGDGAARLADGSHFPSRAEFGAYVSAQLAELGPRVIHLRTRAEEVIVEPGGYAVRCTDGRVLHAGLVVLAVCHTPPTAPSGMAQALGDHPRFVADPWAPGALDVLRPDDRVLIVGTGLTMADIVASLERMGHRGPLVAVSRRGLRSRGHAVGEAYEPYGDFAAVPSRTVRELVREVRATLRRAAAEGRSWHFVFDQLKAQGGAIWRALPVEERRRLVRHRRPFWDVHRFRIAPQVEAVIDRRLADGSLELRRASLRGVARGEGDTIAVTSRERGTFATESFDAVVLATGPAHGRVFADTPLLAALERDGLARPDPIALGIEVDFQGRVIGAERTPNPDMFVAGPLARGTFGELMGVPDVTPYAIKIAQGVLERLAETRGKHG
ncbi:FAD/NAD(P)-binding protein [Ancylobacter sp. A5.8]|uniref:FAD/NAD(P)-binding protein n=1 Tax=Ancylobacter gelatini TaxID=2919920 RepID=UPI001F4EEE1F|nr:FAD/NAD(P)-binding protein [Ancylobacter gelatini]MCJ8141386.1 FAD/NAD(P)-binding protein [Ancylobacter gelatini]